MNLISIALRPLVMQVVSLFLLMRSVAGAAAYALPLCHGLAAAVFSDHDSLYRYGRYLSASFTCFMILNRSLVFKW